MLAEWNRMQVRDETAPSLTRTVTKSTAAAEGNEAGLGAA